MWANPKEVANAGNTVTTDESSSYMMVPFTSSCLILRSNVTTNQRRVQDLVVDYRSVKILSNRGSNGPLFPQDGVGSRNQYFRYFGEVLVVTYVSQ